MNEDFREAFKEEAYELLGELEASLLDLEKKPGSRKTIGRIFRALHTIKGSGAMVGFDDIAAFTHEVETVFELVRLEQVLVTKELIDLTLSTGDLIRKMLDSSTENGEQLKTQAEDIIRALKTLSVAGSAAPAPFCPLLSTSPDSPAVPNFVEASGKYVTYRICFRPNRDIFRKGINPLLLLNELQGLGELRIVAHLDAVPAIENLDPEECFIYWDVILTTREGLNAIRDVFIFVEDECQLEIVAVEEHDNLDPEPFRKKLGEILIERGCLSAADLDNVLKKQKRIGEILVDEGLVSKDKVQVALVEQQHITEIQLKGKKEELASSVRVPAAKLDTLVDLVGELVTVQASLSQLALSKKIPELRALAEHVDRLTAGLRDNTMSLRMQPIGATFNKFNRLVRDLSRELGKDVVMVTNGAETELDKTVIERLNDPLVHLIRNCMDHGIEPPDVRLAAGKPRQGTVRLSAVHSGAHVLITITDDGVGLDKEAIRNKALESGLIPPNVDLSEREIFGLIFAPGFSTARKVSSVSGRGVGMDVVKRGINALRGSIDINSQRGIGTTITLKLPLTLAIIDGLLVRIGKSFFIMPLAIVEECVELTREDVARAHDRHMACLRGQIVPYIRLRDHFGIDGKVQAIEQIVITETEGGKVGLVVDKVIGEHQTVIKNLGRVYRNVEGISGATILGDGSVALILDVPHLVQNVEMQQMQESSVH